MLESRVGVWLFFTVLAGLTGWAYATATGGTPFIGMLTGLVIGASLLGIELS